MNKFKTRLNKIYQLLLKVEFKNIKRGLVKFDRLLLKFQINKLKKQEAKC